MAVDERIECARSVVPFCECIEQVYRGRHRVNLPIAERLELLVRAVVVARARLLCLFRYARFRLLRLGHDVAVFLGRVGSTKGGRSDG